MKTRSILFYFAVLLFISASCSNNEKLSEESISMPNNDQSMTTILNEEDECFNEKMDLWFILFNQYQEEGLTLDEANTKALASVALEFKHCPDKAAASDKRMAKQEVPSKD